MLDLLLQSQWKDFGEVDQWRVEGNHLSAKEEHSEGDNCSGRTGRSHLWKVEEEALRVGAVANAVHKMSHSKVPAFHSKVILPYSKVSVSCSKTPA